MFVDRARITVQGGRGGDGAVSFRREKYVPRGGPDGGNGGNGGNVVFAVDPALGSLMDFRYRRHFAAADGEPGRGRSMAGASGASLTVPVPPGTVVRDADNDHVLADLTQPGQSVIVVHGGRGGRGNVTFRSSTRQAPHFAEKGEPGEAHSLELELKLLADVGLVGLPNAGKSTLLRALSAARPRVAPYPFTTLRPHLGVVRWRDRDIVVADIPGLVAGAHAGAGLGDEFLRHVERTRVLVQTVDAAGSEGRDPLEDVAVIEEELAAYDAQLLTRPRLVVANKLDLPTARENLEQLERELGARGIAVVAVSAATRAGLPELLDAILKLIDTSATPTVGSPPRRGREDGAMPADGEVAIYDGSARDGLRVFAPSREEQLTLKREGAMFVVSGARVERWVAMTDLDNVEGLAHLRRRLERIGLEPRLRQAGAVPGDRVRIGDWTFVFE